MGRKTVLVLGLLSMMAVQMLTPVRARAMSTGEIAIFGAAGAGAFVVLAYLGTKLVYPDKIHLLVPGVPQAPTGGTRARGFQLGPQCGPPVENRTGESLPLFCW